MTTIDSDDLLARIRSDFPHQYEVSQLRCLVDSLTRENDDLHTRLEQAQGRDPSQPATARPFVGSYPLASDTEVGR